MNRQYGSEPWLAKYLQLTSTAVGQDQLLRSMQHFSKFYAWYLIQTNKPDKYVATWTHLKQLAWAARQLLRLTGLTAVSSVVEAGQQQRKPGESADMVPIHLENIKCVSYAGFVLLEAADFVQKMVSPVQFSGRPGKAIRLSNWFWLAAISSGILSILYERRQPPSMAVDKGKAAQQPRKTEQSSDPENSRIGSYAADLLICLGNLRWMRLDDGIVGVAGLISSAFGLHRLAQLIVSDPGRPTYATALAGAGILN